MKNLLKMIKKADAGDAEAQMNVANYIMWEDDGPIDPDLVERAVHYYECAAKQGNSNAMINLGIIYRWGGKGVACDIEKFFFWIKQAAAMLNPIAYQFLGYHYEHMGCSDLDDDATNDKAAFDCFFKGAMLDDPESMYKVGDMYFTGEFVDEDQKFAFTLYKSSEKLSDHSSAAINLRLGECYCMGMGTEQNLIEARKRLEDAIRKYENTASKEVPELFIEGYNKAKHLLKRINSDKIPDKSVSADVNKNRDGYEEFLNSEMLVYPEPEYPIVEIEKLKAENPKISEFDDVPFSDELIAAEAGNKDAIYHIAFYCFNRFEEEADCRSVIDLALYYYHKAVRQGHKGAMFNLGSIYFHGGGGVPIDRQKAFLLYLYSDVHIAQGELGVFYAKGDAVEQDYEKAFKCFARCALYKTSHSYGAFANLALMYNKGIYVEVDEKFAEHLDGLSKKAEEAYRTEYEKT